MDRSRDINFNFDGLIILVVSVQRKIHGRRRNFDSLESNLTIAYSYRWIFLYSFLVSLVVFGESDSFSSFWAILDTRYICFFLFPTTKILLFRIFIGTKKHYPSKVWSANFDENRLTLVGRIIVSKYDLRRIFGSLLIPFNCTIKNVIFLWILKVLRSVIKDSQSPLIS